MLVNLGTTLQQSRSSSFFGDLTSHKSRVQSLYLGRNRFLPCVFVWAIVLL